MEIELTLYLAQKILMNRFASKKEISVCLSVSYRALLRLFHRQSSTHDTQQIMNGIARYCLAERISPEELFQGFSPVR